MKLRSPTMALIAWALAHAATAAAQSDELQHGLSPTYGSPPAPELALPGLDDRSYRLADYRGSVVVVNFWATWCPPCIAEMPTLQAARDLLRDGDFEVLAVNLGEDAETIRRFIGDFETRLEFPILLATDPAVVDSWRIQVLPTSHIVGTAGRLAFSEVGPRDFSLDHVISKIRHLMGAENE